MTTYSFNLAVDDPGPLSKAPYPQRLFIPTPCHEIVVEMGDTVKTGQTIGKAMLQGIGDTHAPLAGTVKTLLPDAILLETGQGESVEPVKLSGLEGTELSEALRRLGLSTGILTKRTHLVVNCVPSEPGITVNNCLMYNHRDELETGLDAVINIVNPDKTWIVAAEGTKVESFGSAQTVFVPAAYPNGLDPLAVKAATGLEIPYRKYSPDVIVLNARDLYFVGRVMKTGLPLTEVPMTIGKENKLVPLGTSADFLLRHAGATPGEGDRIIMGGPLRGTAAGSIAQGICKDAEALSVVAPGNYEPVTDAPCIGCGDCQRACPSRIQPQFISRAAEFKLFDRAENFNIHACMECGICGFVCPARRPILHYIRYAKYELQLMAEAAQEEA